MEKKNNYLKLCLDSETEREAKTIHKRAIIFSIAFTIVVIAVVGIMVVLFM